LCTFFRGNGGISASGGDEQQLEILARRWLVVLIVALIWTGLRGWVNDRDNRPD
jgi:hypothetical protein